MTRGKDEPFGGIQLGRHLITLVLHNVLISTCYLVFVGDFYQLPPVPDFQGASGARAKTTFAFQAECWKKCIPSVVMLTE